MAIKATPTAEHSWLSALSESRLLMPNGSTAARLRQLVLPSTVICPDKPITRKPADVRMGKGKGDPAGWVAPVTPGRILFEVEGVPFETAKEALRLGAQKLPVKTKFVVRRDYDKNA